jgi:hypothetical protein
MLARVRPVDLAWTVVALAGLAAGMVLTIVRILGLTGPVLIAVSIVAAVAPVIPGARSLVSDALDHGEKLRDSLDAVLDFEIKPLGEVDPYAIGIFPSDLAQLTWPDKPQQGEVPGAMPPYVRREVDGVLREALEEASLAATGRLVMLRGDPKSGKSRSLWQAVQNLQDRRMLAVARPDRAAAQGDPGYAPLRTLAVLDRRSTSRTQGRDLVIWVDNAHEHLGLGLDKRTLGKLAKCYPGAVIAMTIDSSTFDGLQAIDSNWHQKLRKDFDKLILRRPLRQGELDGARSCYPALAGRPDLDRLPELFAAVNVLIDRYRSHWADQPFGVAVAKAVIDWERAGMPPGSIDAPTLRALSELTLADIAPSKDMDDQAFSHGLDWAREEVAAFAALVSRERAAARSAQCYRAFDAVVSWAGRNEPPIGRATWNFVFEKASGPDLLCVGIAAYLAGDPETADDAFDRVARSAVASLAAPARAASNALRRWRGVPKDGLIHYDEVLKRIIYQLAEDFMLLHLRSKVAALPTQRAERGGLPPEELAALRPRGSGSPGLGYGRTDEVDGIVGVIAWSVVGTRRPSRGRVRREADRRRLRPEVSDALARFLKATWEHTSLRMSRRIRAGSATNGPRLTGGGSARRVSM